MTPRDMRVQGMRIFDTSRAVGTGYTSLVRVTKKHVTFDGTFAMQSQVAQRADMLINMPVGMRLQKRFVAKAA